MGSQGLLKSYPNVKVIVAPTTVGVLAASQAVKDAGKIGQVYVTGLGLPSEMAGAVHSGATKEFAIWDPIDLGYSATQIAYRLIKNETDGSPAPRSMPAGWARSRSATTAKLRWPIRSSTTRRTSTSSPRSSEIRLSREWWRGQPRPLSLAIGGFPMSVLQAAHHIPTPLLEMRGISKSFPGRQGARSGRRDALSRHRDRPDRGRNGAGSRRSSRFSPASTTRTPARSWSMGCLSGLRAPRRRSKWDYGDPSGNRPLRRVVGGRKHLSRPRAEKPAGPRQLGGDECACRSTY